MERLLVAFLENIAPYADTRGVKIDSGVVDVKTMTARDITCAVPRSGIHGDALIDQKKALDATRAETATVLAVSVPQTKSYVTADDLKTCIANTKAVGCVFSGTVLNDLQAVFRSKDDTSATEGYFVCVFVVPNETPDNGAPPPTKRIRTAGKEDGGGQEKKDDGGGGDSDGETHKRVTLYDRVVKEVERALGESDTSIADCGFLAFEGPTAGGSVPPSSRPPPPSPGGSAGGTTTPKTVEREVIIAKALTVLGKCVVNGQKGENDVQAFGARTSSTDGNTYIRATFLSGSGTSAVSLATADACIRAMDVALIAKSRIDASQDKLDGRATWMVSAQGDPGMIRDGFTIISSTSPLDVGASTAT